MSPVWALSSCFKSDAEVSAAESNAITVVCILDVAVVKAKIISKI